MCPMGVAGAEGEAGGAGDAQAGAVRRLMVPSHFRYLGCVCARL